METSRFDRWRYQLTAAAAVSRRASLGAALTTGVMAALGRLRAQDTNARRKRRKKKAKLNAFGCVDVGNFCKSDEQCCSGICKGKKGKRKCKAHDQDVCQAGQDVCAGVDAACETTTGQPGECVRTTGNASYCAGDGDCFPCQKDADCVPFCGLGAACAVCADCVEVNGSATFCVGLTDGECAFP